ncbi:cytochrome P450 6k1 [Linepithema humile]|uniref:cytochrome P450 6k1 n=1 Tax=Linepithema humile TaxID=83485 RepID=UPI000623291F|nr:PREDICTED: cytochrome P450 6k1-like [Linepithema humile]XP_012224511.1 PREDICTED: cytochrome P450 6k1-like [Linepithema humile]XP_012224512.1 PREDICTED: cytochrome P450 6k1-like [Linepithema humile]XP_012224513.1 PREDICTED: cytochrome P450 6k1-like [Linepithema humile]XP_012224514.1 PREDICTED: cytochrome P450 6k1-like [Linepithema humile]XP_012224515.1 PREDICTED: cytochrome P450 6k1-like [Linepithema humile]XP_012224516.1 PREDICTED: cytochrome P450 6k1-like [Linepithema humile]XP_01222451
MAYITAYWSLDGIIVLTAIITVFYLYMIRNFNYWKKRGILEVAPPTPFLGNFSDCLRFKKAPADFLKEFYDQAKGLLCVGFYILDKPILLIRDRELVKQILVKDFNHFNNRYALADPKDRLNYANLFFIKDTDWKNLRTKLTPFFTSGKMKKMFDLMCQCGNHLDDYLDSLEFEGDGKTIEMKELAIKFTTDLIGSTAFGLEVNSFKDPNAEFCKYSKMLFRFSIIRAYEMLAVFFIPNIVSLVGIKFFGEEPTKFLRKVFWETITARLKSGEKRNDLIEMLIELKQNPDNKLEDFSYDGDDLMAQAASFFSAGSDTSATTLSFALYSLAIRPEMQDKLRKEILEGLDASDGKITYDMTMSLPYLDMVISESLRMHPPLGHINRITTKTYKVPNSNIVIEKGTPIFISMLGMHYDPEYFPNPEKFDPERFNEENKRNRPSCVYFPFGEGPHACIGNRFASLQTKLGLIQILSKFEVTPCEKTAIPIKVDPRGTLLSPVNGVIYLNIRRINNVKI